MFQINTGKVDNLDALKGKRINAEWNGKTLQIKVGRVRNSPQHLER